MRGSWASRFHSILVNSLGFLGSPATKYDEVRWSWCVSRRTRISSVQAGLPQRSRLCRPVPNQRREDGHAEEGYGGNPNVKKRFAALASRRA